MASYALTKGLGSGLSKVADDLGERLKQERLQEYQNQVREAEASIQEGLIDRRAEHDLSRDETRYERDLGLIDREAGIQSSRDQSQHERDKELLQLKASSETGQSATANMRDAQAMVDAGYAESPEDAWRIIQEGNGASVSDAIRVAQMISKDQDEQGIYPDDPSYMAPQQILESAMTMLGQQRGNNAAGNSSQRGDYSSPEDVRAAYSSGDLSRMDASKILRDQFGFQ